MTNSTRRDFIKTAGQSSLAAGLYFNLPDGAWLTADAQETRPAVNENRIECDVLIVGGGYAACYAAIKAREQGATVVMVDKGYAGRSGQSPWATGTLLYDPKKGVKIEDWIAEASRKTEFIGNRYWMETTIANSWDRYQEMLGWGMPFEKPAETEPGVPDASKEIFRGVDFKGNYGDLPLALRQQALKSGTKIMDRIMIAELLKQGGRIVGAVGISSSSKSFDYYTFIAKTTIMAVGACGYKAVSDPPYHQLTGDGEAMAWRAGAEIAGKEFVCSHWARTDVPAGGRATALVHMTNEECPANLRVIRNASLLGKYMEDAAGNRLPGRDPRLAQYPLSYLDIELAAHAGRAPIYQMNFNGTKSEIVGGMALGISIRHGDGIWAADKQCGTTIPGLYAAGDALGTATNGSVYTIGGSSSMGAMVTGAIAGAAAAKEAAKMDKPQVRAEEIARAKQLINIPRERKGGFGPRWVTHLLQNTLAPYFVYFVKKEDRLKAALTQVEFMQEHIVPMLLARDPHELRLAIETKSMVLSAEFRLRSALFRNESRGSHYREDYPRRDDKNWLAWVKIRPEQGKMAMVKVPIPKEWWPDLSIPYEQRYPFRFPGELG